MSSGLGIETFLRISSISVASYKCVAPWTFILFFANVFFSFLATLPVEWRMYRSHGGIKFR